LAVESRRDPAAAMKRFDSQDFDSEIQKTLIHITGTTEAKEFVQRDLCKKIVREELFEKSCSSRVAQISAERHFCKGCRGRGSAQ